MNNDKLSSLKINDNKAGMQNLDKEKINEIILEASKGSKYYDNEVRRDRIITAQINELLKKRKCLSEDMIRKGEIEADNVIACLKDNRDLTRTIVHVDMDAFYAAVEIRDNPNLRNVPMGVGTNQMLSTSNYVARQFGVRAGMPGFIAKKLCPDLILIEPDFDKYTRASKAIRSIFAEYDSEFLSISLDEAYLDLTNHLSKRLNYKAGQMTYEVQKICRCKDPICKTEHSRLFHVCQHCGKIMNNKSKTFNITSWSAVEELRFRVFMETGLTCSAGFASNSLLAKIASDINKPNGQYHVSSDEMDIETFISALSIRKVPGIGKVAERKLFALEINTCGDIKKMRGILFHLFKEITFRYFVRIAIGEGEVMISENKSEEKTTDRKSMSVERTFSDCKDVKILMEKCKILCRDISSDLHEARLQGKCVTIKLKLSTFDLKTRCQTLPDYTSDINIITKTASELLELEMNSSNKALCLRLLGVKISCLISEEMISKKDPWTIQSLYSSTTQQVSLKVVNVSNKSDSDNVEVKCPVCSLSVDFSTIDKHLDSCLSASNLNQPLQSKLSDLKSHTEISSSLKRQLVKDSNEDVIKVIKGPMDTFVIKKYKS